MAEQKPTARTLNYGLDSGILDRVKGASTATAKIARQEMSGKAKAVDVATVAGLQIGAAIDSGAKRTKKLVELGEKWDNALSKEDWGTAEAMDRFRKPLLDKQEQYIQAVKTGDKAAQERLLQELNGAVEGLDGIKTSTNDMAALRAKDGHIDDPTIVPYEDQELAAALAQNTEIDFTTIDGTLYSQYDNTENILGRTDGMLDEDAIDYISGLFDNTDDLREIGGLPEEVESQLTGHKAEDAEILKDYFQTFPASVMMDKFRDGELSIKRNINANGIEKLSKRIANPKALKDQIESTLQTIQEGASSDKATYFDPKNIKSKWSGGFTREDQKLMMTMDVGFGSKFKEDFMAASVLDMPIPLSNNMPLDVQNKDDGDGILTPEELTGDWDNNPNTPDTVYKLTEGDKKLIIEEMMKPENFELAQDHWSTWATMKSAQVHNTGITQRFTEDKAGVRTAVVPPDLIGSGMYGEGYYDPGAINPATGERYDAQIMASAGMSGYNVRGAVNPDGSPVEVETR